MSTHTAATMTNNELVTFVLTAVQSNGESMTVGVVGNEADGHTEARNLKQTSNCSGFTLTRVTFDVS